MTRRRTVLMAGTGTLLWLAGCAGRQSEATSAVESNPTWFTDVPSGPYWHTHPQPTGNRFISGAADLRNTDPVQSSVDGRPVWLVAHPAPQGSYWTVVTAEGTATRWQIYDGTISDETRLHQQLPGRPPVVASGESEPELLDEPSIMS
ncbi:hypothetical protein VB779_14205 [Haloarculaceae archaeon H-GB11]|nr:hypothetical protein [Haloarculaceae archaeon H-GB11]